MTVSEADLIALLSAAPGASRDDVLVDIGDDAAVVRPPDGEELVLCTDTLVDGVHFPAGTDAASVGHKALAVNLSDIAAMGATPRWALLSLTLPAADADWVAAFAHGFDALASEYGLRLIGGDTARGPLAVTVQLVGSVPAGAALTRSGAQPGDRVCVSGTLGDATLALSMLTDGREVPGSLRARLDYPTPRVALGVRLRGVATAAIDVSDGCLLDLGRLLAASGVGAELDVDALPASTAFRAHGGSSSMQLTGGDDYELLFTLPDGMALPDGTASIGRVTAAPGLTVTGRDDAPVVTGGGGYDHFA